ncbi:MAG: polyhydroxyalkanoate synthesis regulator DNA-binding domain-containing protein [Thermoanaerobaculia bacterium]
MVRIIKRYESRKLYDTEESRYVSLDEIAGFVRAGQQVRVVDNSTQTDVTPQMLTQIILDEGRNGRSQISTEFLHDLVRAGERALSSGVQTVQQGVDRFLEASIDRIGPVRQAREEMTQLRSRLEELERSLASLEDDQAMAAENAEVKAAPAARKKAPKRARKKTTKHTAKKTTKS